MTKKRRPRLHHVRPVNMAGGSKPVALTGQDSDIWFDDSNATTDSADLQTDWGRLRMPAERGEGNHAGAAGVLQAAFPNNRIAIVKASQGATSIGYWSTPGRDGHDRLVERIAATIDRLDQQVLDGEISAYTFEGFMWMQGKAIWMRGWLMHLRTILRI